MMLTCLVGLGDGYGGAGHCVRESGPAAVWVRVGRVHSGGVDACVYRDVEVSVEKGVVSPPPFRSQHGGCPFQPRFAAATER